MTSEVPGKMLGQVPGVTARRLSMSQRLPDLISHTMGTKAM